MSLSKVLEEDHLTCSICLERYKEPKVLGCTHSFCQVCLVDYVDKSHHDQQSFPCPECRRQCKVPNGGVSALETNRILVNFGHALDQVRQAKANKKCEVCQVKSVPNPPMATKRCLDCEESMCDSCSAEHLAHKLNREHKLFPVDQIDSDEYAVELRKRQNLLCVHDNKSPVEIFCDSPGCKVFICVGCMVLEHQGHACLRITKAATKCKEELQQHLGPIEEKCVLYTNLKTSLKEQETSVEEERQKAKRQVEEQAKALIEMVHQHSERICEEVDAESDRKLESIHAQLETAIRELTQLTSVLEFSNKLIHHGNDVEVLQMASTCEKTREEVQSLHPHVVPADFSQLQLLVKKPEHCVADINSCFGGVAPAFSGKMVRSFQVKLETSSKEFVTNVATDTHGDIHVGIWCTEDKSRNRIQVYDAIPVLKVTIKKPRTEEKHAFGGIAVDHDGNIVTRYQGSNELIVFTKTGDHVRTFHTESPEAVTVNSKGQYVVAGRSSLTVHDSQGRVLHTTPDPAGKFFKYVSCNVNDDVIVTDQGAHHIRVYDSTLQFRYKYGTKGDGDGQVNTPLGSCCLDNGDIILTDARNHRVHLVSKDGQFKQFILTKEHGLSRPVDVAINHLGQLVVAEGNGMIQMFQL